MKNQLLQTMEVLLCTVIFTFLAGYQTTRRTVEKISDNLDDKALQAHALVDIWKVEMSDANGNATPVGKKITIIGDVKSIPLVSGNGQTVKDYAEYRKTKTPAWYNSDNVTEEESFIGTGDNAKDVADFFKTKMQTSPAPASSSAQ